jgi:hypothetical protein
VSEEDGDMNEIIDVKKVKRMVELCYPGARRPTISIEHDYTVVDIDGKTMRDCVTCKGIVLMQAMIPKPTVLGLHAYWGWRVEAVSEDDTVELWHGRTLPEAVTAFIWETIKPEISMEAHRAYVEMFQTPKCECIEDDCPNH